MQKRDSRESKGESRVSWTKINDCHSDNPHSAADLHFIRLAFFTSFWQEILRKNQRRTLLPSFDVVDSVSWNEGCVLESRVLSGDRRLVNRCRHLSFHLFLVSHPPAFFFLTLLTIFSLSCFPRSSASDSSNLCLFGLSSSACLPLILYYFSGIKFPAWYLWVVEAAKRDILTLNNDHLERWSPFFSLLEINL